MGDLVVHRHAPRGEGCIRLVIGFGKKMFTYIDNTRPHMKATILFADGLHDWKSDWREIQWWNEKWA